LAIGVVDAAHDTIRDTSHLYMRDSLAGRARRGVRRA
jgi:hypothetical protein